MTSFPVIPETLSAAQWALLVGASFITSFITAAFGVGGGISLLALLAQVLPAQAIIPVHGVVQAGSNAGRAALLLAHAQWRFLAHFILGALIGSVVGGQVVVTLPKGALQACLGGFILFMVWGPKLPSWASTRVSIALQGGISSILTMFVGATGPFILAALKPFSLSPQQKMATFSIAMSLQHVFKIIVFAGIGFAYGPYLALMGAMIATGFLGTFAGTRLLRKRTLRSFETWLNILLTLLALRLLYIALSH